MLTSWIFFVVIAKVIKIGLNIEPMSALIQGLNTTTTTKHCLISSVSINVQTLDHNIL